MVRPHLISIVLVAAITFLAAPRAIHARQAPPVTQLIGDLSSPNATVRATAACYLGRLGAAEVRQARELLLGLLNDGIDVDAQLCRDQGGRWNQSEWEESSPGREAAIALEELGSEVLDPLVQILEGGSSVGRENSAFALGLLESGGAVGSLVSALEADPVATVRSRAAWALGLIESASAVPALAGAAGDESAEVRAQAAWALGMIESAEGVPPLLRALTDPSANVRRQAAWGLGMIESASAVDGLGSALRDSDPNVREQAAWALGMIESSRGVEGLIPLLDDPAAAVRRQTAWALGMIEDPAAVNALVQALDDPDPGVREEAMWALGMVLRSAGFDQIDRQELSEALQQAVRLQRP